LGAQRRDLPLEFLPHRAALAFSWGKGPITTAREIQYPIEYEKYNFAA